MCFEEENIIEDGEEGLPEEAQKFKDWYEENMAYAHTEMINGEQAVLMPAFDYDIENDVNFLMLIWISLIWCGKAQEVPTKTKLRR